MEWGLFGGFSGFVGSMGFIRFIGFIRFTRCIEPRLDDVPVNHRETLDEPLEQNALNVVGGRDESRRRDYRPIVEQKATVPIAIILNWTAAVTNSGS